MQEAFQCGDDDIPYIEGGFNPHKWTKKRAAKDCLVTTQEALSDQWQVQKAEPKVLGGGDWYHENYPRKKSWAPHTEPEMIHAFISGDKNGQLKQWVAHKELREAAEWFIQEYNGLRANLKKAMKEALSKIKPPEGI
jgi:hypothetical protein